LSQIHFFEKTPSTHQAIHETRLYQKTAQKGYVTTCTTITRLFHTILLPKDLAWMKIASLQQVERIFFAHAFCLKHLIGFP